MAKKRKNPYAVALGRKGGRKGGPARAASMTPEQRSQSARNAVTARWARVVRDSDADESIDTVITSSPRDCVVDPATKRWLKFQNLVNEWRRERGAMSSITEMAMLPPYQSIIGMGDDAVPLILAELKSEGDEPDQWFWALKAITAADPVSLEDQGNFAKMAQAWLKWAEDAGYGG